MAEKNRKDALAINDQNLKDGWLDAIELIAADKMLYKSAILESEISFHDNDITIHANVVALDFLKGERNRLLDFFKMHYANERVNVLFVSKRDEVVQGDKVLSTREIFELMAEKNPSLKILKDSLGMDFEY